MSPENILNSTVASRQQHVAGSRQSAVGCQQSVVGSRQSAVSQTSVSGHPSSILSKHITVLVSNDLEHDQRVAKVCNTLLDFGFDITLVGRMLAHSNPIKRSYEVKRFRLMFSKGFLFYGAFNVRLFFFLLFKRTDIILANDLDTLLPAFLASRIRGKKLVYDSHEYFTEAEGLTGRTFQKRCWELIERWIFPKLKNVYTVNQSIAEIYLDKYKVKVGVVRNVPILGELPPLKSREELGLPDNKKIILLQGAFIDPDRGARETVEAMQFLENTLLLIIGSGRDIGNVQKMVEDRNLGDCVWIKPKMPMDELQQFTRNADLGLSLDKPVHLNYKFSLPNKLFDYIHAGVPVLASRLPEIERVFLQFEIGMMVENFSPEHLAEKISEALFSSEREKWKKNLELAAREFNWQREEELLRRIYATTS
ncbi:MAG: glycosyltransferase [Flavobacteriales bacterium]|nr:glycosyltransferase [Flavobacteriales bacterium]